MAPRPGLSKAAVLDAAAKLANERGWDQLSIAELAARLRVKPPSLYNHLDSIAGLKRELAIVALRELGAAMSKAAVGKSREDAIRSIADAYRAFVKKHPGLHQAIVRAADPADKALSDAGDEVVNVCLAVLRGYGLNRRSALHALRGLRSAIHGFATLENAGGFGISLNVDESFSWLIGCFVQGLNSAARPSRDRAARAS